MKLIKLGAVVLNQVPLDWTGNKSRIQAAIEAARRSNMNVLCFNPYFISGEGHVVSSGLLL